MQAPLTAQTIERVEVRGLFGEYNYNLPESGELPNPAIFYGDNGVGKSTILRIVFHMLSSAPNKGHRSALLKANFASCVIYLSSGHSLSAIRKVRGDERELQLSINRGKSKIVEWIYIPKRDDSVTFDPDFYSYEIKSGRVVITERRKNKIPQGEAPYLEALREICPTVYYLNAERRLDSDVVADPNDEVELRRAMRMDEPKRIQDLVVRSREIALAQALTNAARWVQRQAVRSTNEGSTNVQTVYVDVLKRLTTGIDASSSSPDRADNLLRRLRRVTEDTSNLSRYELTPALDTSEFYKSLRSQKVAMAADLLTPYIKSLESRLDALRPVYDILDTFINSINRFLVGKEIKFTLSKGFDISTPSARLDARLLSSGEQQLILLFCYVLVARDRPSVFMVDEPEISLNVKWQRKLLQSLQEVTIGANIQFVLASYSMELIAQRRGNVVRVGFHNE